MEKSEKLELTQHFINGMNELTARFAPLGTETINGGKRYIKKEGRYFSKSEVKKMIKLHDDINNGFVLKLDENENEVTDFDDAAKGKPNKAKANAKMLEKYPDENDLADIIDLFFDEKNKNKVGKSRKQKVFEKEKKK